MGTTEVRNLLRIENSTVEIIDESWTRTVQTSLNSTVHGDFIIMVLNVTLDDVTLEVEGDYVIELSDASEPETTFSTVDFRIDTFGM